MHSESDQANKNSSMNGLAKIDETSFDDKKILNINGIDKIEPDNSSDSLDESL